MSLSLCVSPSLLLTGLSAVLLWNSNSDSQNLYFSPAVAHQNFATLTWWELCLTSADVVPLLVLTSRKSSERICQWSCDAVDWKGSGLTPFVCTHLWWNVASVSVSKHHGAPHVSLFEGRIKTMNSLSPSACTVQAQQLDPNTVCKDLILNFI